MKTLIIPILLCCKIRELGSINGDIHEYLDIDQ